MRRCVLVLSFFFFFNDTATTEIYTLFPTRRSSDLRPVRPAASVSSGGTSRRRSTASATVATRSEEHTSELQSQSNLVCRLLLEKKKTYLKHTTSWLPTTTHTRQPYPLLLLPRSVRH